MSYKKEAEGLLKNIRKWDSVVSDEDIIKYIEITLEKAFTDGEILANEKALKRLKNKRCREGRVATTIQPLLGCEHLKGEELDELNQEYAQEKAEELRDAMREDGIPV